MFRFHELTLLGWDLWPQVRIPLDRDVVLVTGPNGSGKTTLLDAIRQLLNARQLSSKRRIQHYLRDPDRPVLIRAVVSNQGRNGSPAPFRRERIHAEEVTLACALVPGRGGAPEKRFAVLPGRTEVDDLRRHLLEGREWYAPERYSRVLEHAGVTRSLLQLLAIEQGKINSMFELSPRDLFRRVLQMLGDQAVPDRYRDARAEYARSRQEVARQADELKLRNADLERVRREVRQRDDWEEQRDKLAELERRLPAAELQVFIRQRKDAAAKIPELQTKVRKGETECGRRADEVERCSSEAEEAQKALAHVEQGEREAQESWGDAREQRATARSVVQDLEGKARRAAEMAVRNLTALEEEEETCRQTLAAAEQEATTTRERVIGLEKRVTLLRTGQAVLPETVRATLEALGEAGVKAELFCDLVEVRDETYADAVEAALGDARYALLVDAAGEAKALFVAKANGFPGGSLVQMRQRGADDDHS